jgi:hypothetical protein
MGILTSALSFHPYAQRRNHGEESGGDGILRQEGKEAGKRSTRCIIRLFKGSFLFWLSSSSPREADGIIIQKLPVPERVWESDGEKIPRRRKGKRIRSPIICTLQLKGGKTVSWKLGNKNEKRVQDKYQHEMVLNLIM